MLVVAVNRVVGALDIILDEAGIARLRSALDQLERDRDHLHLYGPAIDPNGLTVPSPWGHEDVFGELILSWAGNGEPAFSR